MKKLVCCILSFALIFFSFSMSCFAKEITPKKVGSQTVVTENLGNGFTVETKTNVYSTYSMLSRTSTRSATRTKTYKANGSTVANVTLKASFDYNGSSAWVTNKSASHSVVSGWSYGNESLAENGATASLYSTLTQWTGIIPIQTIDVNISLTCSPSGQIF